MGYRRVFSGLRAFVLGVAIIALAACGGRMYVRMGPPPLRVEVVHGRPGAEFVWIAGYWGWHDHDYYWIPGHWERIPHRGAIWIRGDWRHHHRRGWYWVPGHWR